MKRTILVILFSIFALVGSVNLSAGVITGPFVPGTGNWTTITNGGFESGLAGWSTDNCNTGWGTFSTDHSGPVAQGTNSAQSNPIVTKTGPGFCMWREVTLSTSTTYVFSGFFNTGELDAYNIYTELVSGNLLYEAAKAGGLDLALGEEQWQFAWMEFTPTQLPLFVRMVHDGDFTPGKHGYFDEIAITEASLFSAPTVPIPATLWLFSTGLIGLVGIARGKKA